MYICMYIDTLLGGFSIQNRRGQSQGNLNESPLQLKPVRRNRTKPNWKIPDLADKLVRNKEEDIKTFGVPK